MCFVTRRRAPDEVLITYYIPDIASPFEMPVSLTEPVRDVLQRARVKHSRPDLFSWALNVPTNVLRDDLTFQSFHKPGNVFHFLPRHVNLEWLCHPAPGAPKPKAKVKSVWQSLMLNDSLTVNELLESRPREFAGLKIFRAELGDQVLA
jgi:hypothetical protein